jgi:hypothetical protein
VQSNQQQKTQRKTNTTSQCRLQLLSDRSTKHASIPRLKPGFHTQTIATHHRERASDTFSAPMGQPHTLVTEENFGVSNKLTETLMDASLHELTSARK